MGYPQTRWIFWQAFLQGVLQGVHTCRPMLQMKMNSPRAEHGDPLNGALISVQFFSTFNESLSCYRHACFHCSNVGSEATVCSSVMSLRFAGVGTLCSPFD